MPILPRGFWLAQRRRRVNCHVRGDIHSLLTCRLHAVSVQPAHTSSGENQVLWRLERSHVPTAYLSLTPVPVEKAHSLSSRRGRQPAMVCEQLTVVRNPYRFTRLCRTFVEQF